MSTIKVPLKTRVFIAKLSEKWLVYIGNSDEILKQNLFTNTFAVRIYLKKHLRAVLNSMNDNIQYAASAEEYIKEIKNYPYLFKFRDMENRNTIYEIHELEYSPNNHFHNILAYALTENKAQELVDSYGKSFGSVQPYCKKDDDGSYNIGTYLYGNTITIIQCVYKRKTNYLDLTNSDYNYSLFDL